MATSKELRCDPSGVPPEKVLVLETLKTVSDFRDALHKAVQLEGERLEWLLDAPLDDIDENSEARSGRPWRLYLIMANYGGARELVNKFDEYRNVSKKFRSRAAWRHLFDALHDLRFWGVKDRLISNGTLDYWLEDLKLRGEIRFEVELWWHQSEKRRRRAITRFVELLTRAGGRIVDGPLVIEGIRYCGLLVEVPAPALEKILPSLATARENPDDVALPPDVTLLKCDEVMFFRPHAQADVVLEQEELTILDATIEGRPAGEPIVAVLDGVPLENHVRLSNRIIVHDPDLVAEQSLAQHRRHGTAMASLIIHGDLNGAGTILKRPIVIRPLMPADPQTGVEELPDDKLILDQFHIAVHDLVTNEAFGSIKVINVSLGDRTRLFDGPGPSPWARLLDHLAFEHNLLFIVSAGNSSHGLKVEGAPHVIREQVRSDRPAFAKALLSTMYRDVVHRKLLSPAESINALTVGALHADEGKLGTESGFVFDPLPSATLPSPMTSFGLGVSRAVKPDLVLPGGRQPLREPVVWEGDHGGRFEFARRQGEGGHRVAAPGGFGSLDGTALSRGTSNAAALATRAAAQLHAVLEDLRTRHPGRAPDPTYDAVLLKAMLAHGARWPDDVHIWQDATGVSREYLRDETARVYGYGIPDFDHVAACTEVRATGIGVGRLEDSEALVFRFPLPECLGGLVTRRRLIVTLAYLTPIHAGHQSYRRARLWVAHTDANKALGVSTVHVGSPTANRGTLAHVVLEGEGTAVDLETRQLEFKVNCRAAAGRLTVPVPFALLVSLEVAEGEKLGLQIYEQVAQRLRERVRGRG